MKKILLIALASLSFSLYAEDLSPEKVAENFYKEVLMNDGANILQYFDNTALEKASAEEKEMMKAVFSMMKTEMNKNGVEILDVKAGEVSYNDDKSKAEVNVIVVIKDKSGQTNETPFPIQLGKVNGQWKVLFE